MSGISRQIHHPIMIKKEPAEVIDATSKNQRRCKRCRKWLQQGLQHHCTEKFKCSKCPPERYKCTVCNYRGMLLVSYYKHVQRSHKQNNGAFFNEIPNQFKMYFCEWCSCFKTYSQLMYISHIKRCPHYKPYKETKSQSFNCQHCSFKSKIKAALRYHEKNNECRYIPLTDGILQCKLCLYNSKIPQAFRNHVELTHMLNGRFKCQWCDFRATRVNELTQHMTTHIATSQIIRFKCDLCPFQTEEKSGLKQHVMKNHIAPTNMKWRKCKICKQQELKVTYKKRGSILCGCVHKKTRK